ncbi:hypothetical protein QWM81_25530 [Streptomyces ficellus]|uniref:Integral-membrane protein n=1 Tax=Streptomyces ficellus TaxID=1977088 RepID=A0ABT7ZCV5_9ACTN|nr:hypothetical protein [Streptomyces ficellus]MDN3297344.1 hypothetical protein [Streptomyces ficellus]
MSAHGVPPASLLVAFGVTGGLAWLAAGRRRGSAFIGTGLLTVQGVLHVTFMGGGGHLGHGAATAATAPDMTAGAAPGAMTPGMAPDAMAGMAHGATMPGVPAGPGGLTDLLTGLVGGASAGMLAVHLLAAAVCALWLARGEAAFFRLARAIGALAFTPLRPLLGAVRLPDAPRPPRPRPRTPRRDPGVVLAHTLSRRGPPAPALSRATVPGATHV